MTTDTAGQLREALDARAKVLLVTRANDEPYMEGYFDARSVALAAEPSGPVEPTCPNCGLGRRANGRCLYAWHDEPLDDHDLDCGMSESGGACDCTRQRIGRPPTDSPEPSESLLREALLDIEDWTKGDPTMSGTKYPAALNRQRIHERARAALPAEPGAGLRDPLQQEREGLRAAHDEPFLRERVWAILHAHECDELPAGHSWREHLPWDAEEDALQAEALADDLILALRAASPDTGVAERRTCIRSMGHQGLHKGIGGEEWSWFETTDHWSPSIESRLADTGVAEPTLANDSPGLRNDSLVDTGVAEGAGLDVATVGAALIEWRTAVLAYNAEVAKGPVIPPDEPDFRFWDRMVRAEQQLHALAACLAPDTGVAEPWPTLDEFRRMTPAEVNAFFERVGCDWRVPDAGVAEGAGLDAGRIDLSTERDDGKFMAADDLPGSY